MNTTQHKADDAVLAFRCPRSFVEAINMAANNKLLSKSAYVRQATLQALKQDGVKVA
jgi:hypothetical protein